MTDGKGPRDLAADVAEVLAGMLVRRFRNRIYEQIGAGLPVPVRDGTYPVLVGLRRAPATAAQLSVDVGVDRTVASRHASQLVAAGLVSRQTDPRDRRGGLLSLTAEGRRVADTLHERAIDLIAGSMSDWSDDDRRTFLRLLRQLSDDLQRDPESGSVT